MINNEEPNAFKNEIEAIELTDAALTAVTGGTEVEEGVKLEPGIWRAIGSGIFQYNGPVKFVPSSESIPFDYYFKFTVPGAANSIFYLYAGKLQQQAYLLSRTHEVHSGNEPFPYPIM